MNPSLQKRTFWERPSALVLWGLAIAALSYFLAFEQLPLPGKVAPLETMQFAQDGSPGSASAVHLPDNWRSHELRPAEPGTYRTEFEYRPEGNRWAVFIPGYSGQIQVRINDVELNTGGFLSGELIPDQSVPFFVPIVGNILIDGGNIIEVDLRPGGKLVGFLGDVYIGPEKLLRNSMEWHYLRAVRLPELVVFWQLLLALLLMVLWLARRHERAALYCCLILAFSSVHGIPVYLPSSVAISHAAALLGYVVNFWLSVLGLLFTYSLTNRELPVKAHYLLVLPALATVAYLILPQDIFHYVDMFAVVPFSLVMTGWVVVALVYSALWKRHWESRLLLISVLGACTLVIHDTLIIQNVTPGSNFLHFRIVYVMLLPALSVIFFQRLIQSMHHVDDLVSTLEERVEQKESQLRQTFKERQTLERRQDLNDERRRIMRDVHDGLGGQLMSIIALSRLGRADPEDIESSARAALEDLRMLIGSLDVEDDITGMLGTFRERAEQQLALSDIALEWRMIDIPAIDGLSPSHALNILRILQEATTNAAKHSLADRMTIRFSLTSEPNRMLIIDIEDNGRGHGDTFNSGHGLKNMHSRARELNGVIKVTSSAQGTRVSFAMPLSIEPDAPTDGEELD